MKNRLFLYVKEVVHALVWFVRHVEGRYKIDEIALIRRFVSDGDICLDVGAHAGAWTKPLSRLVPAGRVYAFEALPYYARVLSRLIWMLRLKNVTLIAKAVSDKDGTLSIAWKGADGQPLTGCTHIATAQDENPDTISVETLALDSLLPAFPAAAKISFIKIDIEGAELLAVKGAARLIARFRPVFYLEVFNDYCKRYGYTHEDLFSLFAGLNYTAFHVGHRDGESGSVPVTAGTYPGKGDVIFIPLEHTG